MSEMAREFARTYTRSLLRVVLFLALCVLSIVLVYAFVMWPLFLWAYVENGTDLAEAWNESIGGIGTVWWVLMGVWNLLAWPAVYSVLKVTVGDEA